MTDTPRTDAEDPDLINLMEWNRFAEQGMTLLEVLTILNNRHRADIEARMAAEIHAMRELNAAKAELAELKKVICKVYYETETYADGAPDATDYDKLCNEVSSQLEPFIK